MPWTCDVRGLATTRNVMKVGLRRFRSAMPWASTVGTKHLTCHIKTANRNSGPTFLIYDVETYKYMHLVTVAHIAQ